MGAGCRLGRTANAANLYQVSHLRLQLTDGLANFGYTVFFVAFEDFVLVFDAPVNRAVTAQAITLIKEKLIHQGDMLGIPRSGSVGPANDVTVHFAEAIDTLGLDVEVISGVHGTVGEYADLELALTKREALGE